MAFGSTAVLGTVANSTANQTSTTLTTGGTTISAGELLVIVVAVDNNATTDGDEGAVTSVTAGVNNLTKAAEFTNGQGAAQAGATCSVWYSIIGTTTTSNVVANFSNSTSRDKSVISGWRYTVTNSPLTLTTNTLAVDGGQPGSLDATTTNTECLRIRAIAGETNSTTALTATSGWTSWDAGNGVGWASTGGGAAANIALRVEHRIVTGTNDASNPSYASVDHASVYVAFQEPQAPKSRPHKGPAFRFFRIGF